MSKKHKSDGGPVHPCKTFSVIGGFEQTLNHTGISLRDHFAVLALQGMLRTESLMNPAEHAHVAYEFADALLKAREQS